MASVDPKHYQPPHGPVTDADGRITLPDLIPGAPYRIVDWSTANVQTRACNSAKTSPSSPAKRSTSVTSWSKNHKLDEKPETPLPRERVAAGRVRAECG